MIVVVLVEFVKGGGTQYVVCVSGVRGVLFMALDVDLEINLGNSYKACNRELGSHYTTHSIISFDATSYMCVPVY